MYNVYILFVCVYMLYTQISKEKINKKMGKTFRACRRRNKSGQKTWNEVESHCNWKIQIKVSVRYHFDLDDGTSEEDNTKGTEGDVEQREQ